jgi:hypothetical protein
MFISTTLPHGVQSYARRRRTYSSASQLDFAAINAAALAALPNLLPKWLPNGRREGREWVALNPRRDDRRLGSFSVNTTTGKWADFSSGERGGDVVSLHAFILGTTQADAARRLAKELGVRA